MGIDLRKTKWLQNVCSPYTLPISNDRSVVIANNREQSINIYKGRKSTQLQLSIKLYPALNGVKLCHDIKVQEHYVVCYLRFTEEFEGVDDDYVTSEVLMVNTNGEILRSFVYLSMSDKLNLPNHLAVNREESIIVANGNMCCLSLQTKAFVHSTTAI